MDFSARKISQVLQTLASQDIYKFQEFLESPYFLKKDAQNALIPLFNLLTRYILTDKNFEIPDEKLAQIISNSPTLEIGKLEKNLTQLNHLLYQFFGIEAYINSNALRLKTAGALREKEAYNLWESFMKKNHRLITSQNNTGFQNSMDLLNLKYEDYEYKTLSPFEVKVNYFNNIIDGFNEFYLINMLQIALSTIAHNQFYFPIELQSQFTPLQSILNIDSTGDKNPEKKLLIMAFNLLTGNDPRELERLEEMMTYMNDYADSISHNTKVNVSTIIKNYATRMYNMGDLSVGKFIFNFYKQNIANKLLFHGSKIQVASIFNIAYCAINEREFEWLEQFMEDIKDQILELQLKDFTLALVKAKVHFAKKEYEAALGSLDYNVVLPFFKGIARTLEIMILYELNSQQLEHKMEAFKIYMYRTKKAKVNPRFQIGYNNFIGILRSINHPKTDFDLKRIEKIISKIKSTEILAQRTWLLQKLNEKADKIRD